MGRGPDLQSLVDETWIERLDQRINSSRLKARKSSFSRELCAAISVFLTVAQIIALNPAILSASGGPCTVNDCTGQFKGTAQCRNPNLGAGYAACVADTSKSLVATTCIAAALGCLLMALLANMPLILAPGMGVNSFLTFGVVGQYGSEALTYQQGMAVVLVTALLILAASVIGLRGRLMQLFPSHLVFAMVVGLGLFLELLGTSFSRSVSLRSVNAIDAHVEGAELGERASVRGGGLSRELSSITEQEQGASTR